MWIKSFSLAEKVILAVVGSNVRFHIQNLVLGGRNRIGCFTLIHNVPRCVKLLPCQKKNSPSHCNTRPCHQESRIEPGCFPSAGEMCLCICVRGVGLRVKLFQELSHPSLPLINNPSLITFDTKQTIATTHIWSSSMTPKHNCGWGRLLFSGFSTVPAHCCCQPNITCKCFNWWRLTFCHKGRTAEQHQ